MKTHSPLKKNRKTYFFNLIDHRVCFDYLLGFYVNAFRRDLWIKNLNVINKKLMKTPGTWSTFDNTCFFIKFSVLHLKILKLLFAQTIECKS